LKRKTTKAEEGKKVQNRGNPSRGEFFRGEAYSLRKNPWGSSGGKAEPSRRMVSDTPIRGDEQQGTISDEVHGPKEKGPAKVKKKTI